nr:MAG TPA: hypothetical protein [Caudoviricetes sp.]
MYQEDFVFFFRTFYMPYNEIRIIGGHYYVKIYV